jgi:hypothetical protein
MEVGYAHGFFDSSGWSSGAGLGDLHGAIERGLNCLLLGGRRNGPTYRDAGEGLGNEEAIPRSQNPGALRVYVDGSNGSVDELGKLRDAGLGDLRRSAGAIGSNGDVLVLLIGAL